MSVARQTESANWPRLKNELDRRQPAVQQQRQRGADDRGDDEVAAGGEHEAEDERDVAEREGVRVAAELEMDDAALADEEPEREPPPGDVRLVQRRQAVDGTEEEGDRGGPDGEVQPPDRMHAAQRGANASLGISTPSAIELESVPMGRPNPASAAHGCA